MKTPFIIIVYILSILQGISQEVEHTGITKNGLLIQYDFAGGTRPSFSARYERTLFQASNVSYRLYLGFSHSQPLFNPTEEIWYGVPIGTNIIAGNNRTHFETGFGYWYLKVNEERDHMASIENFFHLRFGFRYQKLEKTGLIIRFGIKPGVTWFRDYDVIDVSLSGNYYFSLGFGF